MSFFTKILCIFESTASKKQRIIANRERLRRNYLESIMQLKKSPLTQKEKQIIMLKLSSSFRKLLKKL